MTEVGVHHAKTHLSKLLRRVTGGEEIIITLGGRPVAKLVPVAAPTRRVLGRDRGSVTIADDFDAPLPDELLDEFDR
ncbi:MAG: type II toxin-antitoxin system Phd/YefM family antitoxin [Actinomycetota bacterium]|nr:type II toxin-antitoxin system Phd/YefM family antitoxin [Acidothermales bacterium]MDQ3432444.1 type II toxin-antitoxin system Phd/YefM family antitoxin [Actinomycetota bacterium]